MYVNANMEYIVDHAEARFAIVEDQEQVDKLLHVKERCPRLEHIIYDGPRGMRAFSEPFLMSLAELYLGLTGVGERKRYRDVKHHHRRQRWLS